MQYSIWLEEWLTHCVKPTIKQRTCEFYRNTITKHIVPILGDFEMTDLSPLVIQKLIADLLLKGNLRTGKGLSPSYVKTILSVIQSSLKAAQLFGHLDSYSADKIKRPRTSEKRIECFSVYEQKKIENAALSAKKSKYKGIVLCLYSGLRIGELLALTWNDIDFINGALNVTKTCHDGNENGKHVRFIDTPKTEKSIRRIPLSKSVIKMLREMKKKSRCEYIISDGEKPVFVRSYQRTFELLLRKLDIPHKGFHSLRHTFATRAVECGMDVKSLAEILGHKNASVTLNRYTHSLWEHKAVMMNKLSRIL